MEQPGPAKAWALLPPMLMRLGLILMGAGALLQNRMETASPLSSLQAAREAWAQLRWVPRAEQFGPLPLNPLLAPLSLLADSPLLAAAPNMAADAAASWLLSRTFGSTTGRAYLWNPFALLSCLSSCSAPLYNLLVIAAAWAAAAGRPVLAAAALAGAMQLSIHALLFAVPLLMLLSSGPEPSGPAEEGNVGSSGAHTSPLSSPGGSTSSELTSRGRAGRRESSSAVTQGLAEGAPTKQQSGATGEAAGSLHAPDALSCAAFAAALVAASALLLLAEAGVVAALGETQQWAQHGRPNPLGWVRGEPQGPGLAALSKHSWFVRRLLFVAQVESLDPNLGLHWYLFAEVFPKFRGFFLYCLHAMPAALAVPLALRFPRRPLLCLLCQALANCLLGPYPTYGDIALWLAFLPAAAPQLARMWGKGWWAISFLAALALNTAAYELWWVRGVANANFLYGMNLGWAAWQVLFTVHLIKATARLEAEAAEQQQRPKVEG